MDLYEKRERWPVGQINPKTGLSFDYINVSDGIDFLLTKGARGKEELRKHLLERLKGYQERFETEYNSYVEVNDQNRAGIERINAIVQELREIAAAENLDTKKVRTLAKEIKSIVRG